jgi:tRNA modification GTPase
MELDDPASTARRELAAELEESPAVAPVVVVNKTDLVAAPPSGGCIHTSALANTGLDALLKAVSRRLVPQPPAPGAAVPFTSRHVKLLQAARDHVARREVASAVAVLENLIGTART